jgi:hypothetical protein
MTNTDHLEPFDFSNLIADKAAMPATRHAVTARDILEGKAPTPPAPDLSPLPNLYNAAVMAVRGAQGAEADLDAAVAESKAAGANLEAVLASTHEGLSEKDAVASMRRARDRADLAGLQGRRARSVLDQVRGHRRKALAELGAAVEAAAMTTTTLCTLRAIADLEAGIDAGCRQRFQVEIERAVNTLALTSGDAAAIGGRAELLHGRLRDLRVDDPSEAAIAHFLRTCRELIDLMTPPAPSADMPVDPILRGIVDASKPRRRRAA